MANVFLNCEKEWVCIVQEKIEKSNMQKNKIKKKKSKMKGEMHKENNPRQQ